LVSEIQHISIGEVAGKESEIAEIGDDGSLLNSLSIVGILDFDLGFESAAPGSDGSRADLNILDLEVGSLVPLEPGSKDLHVVEVQGGEILPIVNVTAGLGQG